MCPDVCRLHQLLPAHNRRCMHSARRRASRTVSEGVVGAGLETGRPLLRVAGRHCKAGSLPYVAPPRMAHSVLLRRCDENDEMMRSVPSLPVEGPGYDSRTPAALDALPARLRVVARLAVAGLTRAEVKHVLDLSDTALRKRISDLRRVLGRSGAIPGTSLRGGLAFGAIRKTLLGAVHGQEAVLASHDPDGHLFVLSRSHFSCLRQQPSGHDQARSGCLQSAE